MSMAPGPPPPQQAQVVVPGAGWVDVASRAIVQVGFPVVVAGVLLWFLLTKFQDNMNTITSRMAANTQNVADLINTEKGTLAELQRQTIELQEQTATLRDIADKSARLLAIKEREPTR
jgi:hypothetical protein